MNALKNITSGIDSCGLAVDIPAEQLDQAAEQLATIDHAIELVKGDLYRLKLDALDIKPGTSVTPLQRSQLEEFCRLMGGTRTTIEHWAVICKRWLRGDRVIGMGISHYNAVAGMDKAAARDLLLKAQLGDPQTDWATTGHQPAKPWKMWSAARIKKERAILEGRQPEAEKAASDGEASVLDAVDRAVSGLPKTKRAPVKNKMERAIKKEFAALQNKFTKAVEDATAERVQKEQERISKLHDEWTEKKDTYETLSRGVVRPITMEEFKVLRQFCHPDKHPGNEARAGQAYEIVCKVGERLKFIKKKAG